MNTLSALQADFQGYLLDPSYQRIASSIVSTARVPAETRLAIYANAYELRLLEALVTSYPVLQAYVGHDAFDALGREYIHAYPSPYRSVRWFGDALPAFLREHVLYKDYPYLAELAHIEWTMTLVFDALDSKVLHLDDIARIPQEAWSAMRFISHPSMHCLCLAWNVVSIWQAISNDEELDAPLQNTPAIHWVFWRHGLVNHFGSLGEDEAFAIEAMAKGMSFGEICEGLCLWMDEEQVAGRAASLLKGWVLAGLIVGVEV